MSTQVLPHEPIEEYLDQDGLRQLVGLMFAPRLYCYRVTESIDLTSDIPNRKTVREFSGLTGKVLIPVAYPARDRVADYLHVEKNEGEPAQILSRELTIVAMRAVLGRFARTADLDDDLTEVVASVVHFVPIADVDDGIKRIAELRRVLIARSEQGGLTEAQAALINALQLFARRRPLLVACQASDLTIRLSVEHVVSYLEMQQAGAYEGVRSAIGRAPDSLIFDAPLATRTQSYHFRLQAPGDYYVRALGCRRKLKTNVPSHGRYVRSNYERFSNAKDLLAGVGPNPTEVAHLRALNLGALSEARFGAIVRLRLAEKPLGRQGAALARVVISLLASLLIPLSCSSIVVAGDAAIATVLLGLPALLGASLIASRSDPRLRSPLLAGAVTVVSVISAIASTLTFTVWTVDAAQYGTSHPHEHVTVFYPPGGVLASYVVIYYVTLATAALTAWMVYENVRDYRQALHRYREQDLA